MIHNFYKTLSVHWKFSQKSRDVPGHLPLSPETPRLVPRSNIWVAGQIAKITIRYISSSPINTVWDICANTVIPATWFCGSPCPLTGRQGVGVLGVKPISHAWVADKRRSPVLTEANQQMWLVVRMLYSTTLLISETCLYFLLHHVFPIYVITQWGSA